MISKKNNLSLGVFILVSACLLFFNFSYFPNNILSWDVFGYYMYLPVTFIYHDWKLLDIGVVRALIEQYHSSSTLYQAYQTETGLWVMRYSMGMAVLYAPFFFIGHIVALAGHFPKDGFSLPYQVAILSGGIIYSITGFWFLRKILLRYFPDFISALSLFIIFFGTNYFWHNSFHGSNAMTHNYLFTLYAIIIWSTIRWHETFKIKYVLLLGLACGLNIIARPSEIICLFIPFLWETGTKYSLLNKLKLFLKMKIHVLILFLLLLLIGMPQLIYWKIISGKFLFNSYGNNAGEGFEFLHPYFMEVLFSFRKGWLVYTPVMFLTIVGILLLLKKKNDFSLPVIIFFLFNIYIVSSWSCWWYAESFSQRSLIQSYAVLALPLGFAINYFFNSAAKWIRVSTVTILCLVVSLNLFQTWQFFHGIIHPSRMTKQAYMASIGKTKIPESMKKLLLIDRDAANRDSIDEKEYFKTKECKEDFETVAGATIEQAFSGTHSFMMDSSVMYSPSIEKPFHEITSSDHAKLKVSFRIYCSGDVALNPGSIVAAFDHKGYSYGYKSTDIENLNIESNNWATVSMFYLTPVIRIKSDKLKVYYWQRGKMSVYIDDIIIEVWERKALSN